MSTPAGAPADCPGGPGAEDAGKASACAGCPNQAVCAAGGAQTEAVDPDAAAIAARMALIRHKVLVLSGKGGVGKSTFSAQLAFALAAAGNQVGLLDIDICGPSIPRMLGLQGEEVHQSSGGWSPVFVSDNLGVMSIGFMLSNQDDAVIWRGPRKNGLIKQFLKDVDWGQLDYLIVDSPPGTSDEHISITQYLKACGVDGAVLVTTPQEVSLADVRKEISFCQKVCYSKLREAAPLPITAPLTLLKVGLRVLGVVENMSGLSVPVADIRFKTSAGDVTAAVLTALLATIPDSASLVASIEMFCSESGGAERMAAAWNVPFLGKVPLDSALTAAAEAGQPLPAGSLASPSIQRIVEKIAKECKVAETVVRT